MVPFIDSKGKVSLKKIWAVSYSAANSAGDKIVNRAFATQNNERQIVSVNRDLIWIMFRGLKLH
jgi:hypothetical protein